MALHDANLEIHAQSTEENDFSSPAFSIKGMMGAPLYVEVAYKDAKDPQAPVNSTAQFNIEHSFDGGTNWHLLTSGASDKLTLNTIAKAGRIYLPVNTDAEHIRLTLDFTDGDGSSDPEVTFLAYLVVSKP